MYIGPMFSALSKFILKIIGWKIKGQISKDLHKYILIAAPHTSMWDFPMGLLLRSARKMDVSFMGKHTLFKPPFGFIMRWLGGIPVDRSQKNKMVENLAAEFNKANHLVINIAPEGTREKVDKLKSGFYYIAKAAKVPIVMVVFDFEHKEFRFSAPFYPTDDKEADMAYFWNHFKGVKGKVAENSIF